MAAAKLPVPERHSIRLPDDVPVRALKDLLGAKLVAYIGAVKETRAVRQWADGERKPSADVMRLLRRGKLDDACPQVVVAAHAFAAAG